MKRMTNKFWLVILTILLSISCAKEELAYDLAENNSQDILRDYSLPQEEAIQIFEQYMKALNTEGTTRNVVSKTTMITKINRVDISRYLSDNSPVTRGTMKSQTGIPMYEITTQNSANTNGFAVVVGDKRFPEVIAYALLGPLQIQLRIKV